MLGLTLTTQLNALSLCLHFSLAYFQLVSTSFYHLNCNATRSFSHTLPNRSETFLHTRLTIPLGFCFC